MKMCSSNYRLYRHQTTPVSAMEILAAPASVYVQNWELWQRVATGMRSAPSPAN